jgi:hypothetical protein
MARLALADGSRKLRESVLSTNTHITPLDIGGNRVFLLNNALQYPTTNGGGLETEHKGVFQDDEALTLVDDPTTVGAQPGQAYIIGAAGIVIGSTTLPGNHVLVSLLGTASPPDEPINHAYAVSYVVRGDSGSHDITAAAMEFIELGQFTITYRGAT